MLYNALAAVGGCVTPAAALLLEFDGNTVVDARGPHARRARKDEAKQRKRAANGTKSSAPPPRAVCDCTHFCYSPEFWRGAFFPALRRSCAARYLACLLIVTGKVRSGDELRKCFS